MIFKKKKKPWIDFTRFVRPADICVSFNSWIISLLVWLKDGFKKPPTHNMHVHTFSTVASAEATGYKELDLNEALNSCKRVMVFRFKNLTDAQVVKLQRLSKKYFKKKYDFSLYFIAILRIMLFFIPLMFLLVLKTPLHHVLGLFIILLILYFPFLDLLRKWEKVTVACSEAEGELYSAIGLLKGIDDATNLTPYTLLLILLNRPDVRLIIDTKRIKK